MRTRRTALLVLFAVFGTLLAPTSIETASADGTPDLLLAKTVPQVALLGAEVPVTLSVTNASGPNGYNVSFTETLPAGVSYVTASSNPEPDVLPQGDGTTVLVWTNVADAITGASVELNFSIVAGAGFDPGDSVITSSGVYAHSNPRTVPNIDPSTGLATGDFSGSDTASRSTRMLAFALTKTEPSAEAELLRGVHDHQTVYTLTIDNNLVQGSSGFSIIDYLPAALDYLGCAGVDNSSGEEYVGAGAVNPGNEPTLVNPCITPSNITTVNLDPDGVGPQPTGVHTRLTWDAATLATSLPASGSFSMDYLAAIPLQENVQSSVGDLTANLDNNTGALTTETEDELESYAVASGIYGGDGSAHTDTDYHEIVAEDISVHKSVDSETFAQGDTPTFTLEVETSEYALSSGPVTVTDTLPPALDFTGASPAADSAVTQGDGSTLITWTLPAFAAPSQSSSITVNTLVRTTYRNGDGSAGSPVASNDYHTNTTALSADVTVMADNAGATTAVALVDTSSADQAAGGPSILKEVSEPVAGTLTCGDGTGVTFVPTTALTYRPGDRVCFRLSADFPGALDSIAPTVTDLLPAGFSLESWVMGASSDIDSSGLTFTDDTSYLTWELGDQDVGAIHVEIVLSTIIDAPDAASDADIIDNLMKLRYNNTPGDVFQLRDQATAVWAEPQLTLDKGVTLVNGGTVPGAPADDVNVEEGDLVTFQLDITNSGTVSALDTTVRDELPAEVSCADVSAISTGGTCDGANNWITWDVSSDIDIGGGAASQLTYVLTIPVGTSAGASLTNRAGVRTYEGETNTGANFTFIPTDNIDSTLTANTAAADDSSQVVTSLPTLVKAVATSITEAGNDATTQATIGETISYTIDVDLPDAITYYNATFTDMLDADKDLIEASVAVTLDGAALPAGFVVTADDATNSLTIDFPTTYAIADGADEQLQIAFDSMVVDTASNVRGHVSSNQADLDFEDVAGTPRNVTDSVDFDVVEPNITIDKDHDDSDGKVVAGQVVTYTIDIANPATGDVSVAHETVVVDTIPDELILLEAPGDPAEDGDTIAPDGGAWNESSRTVTWSLGSIDPGDTTSLGYEIEIGNPLVAAGTLTNAATVTASSITGTPAVERTSSSPNGDSEGDGYLAEAESSVVVPVLDLTKSVATLTATVGDAVPYTLDIELPEAVIAYDVTAIDDLPPGLVFEAITSVTCDQGGSTCSPDINSATPITGGGDVAFFLGDLTTEASGDRLVTIEYLTVVDDVPEADDGSTLQNTAAVHWNDTDLISGTPLTVPATASFSDSSGPWSVVVNTDEPTLLIDKDVIGQVSDDDALRAKPGDTLSYVITVENTGTSPAYSALVNDVPTDDSWAFTDTTATAGITNTDADPVGGVEWLIDGPIAPGSTATITYDLLISTSLTAADKVTPGADASNTVDIPSYFGVDGTIRAANPGRPYRDYDDVGTDQVELELDLASIGDFVWFDRNGDGVQDVGEPGLPDVDVIVTYLGIDGTPGGGDDEVTAAATDNTGRYLAEFLPGGNYTVDVDETDPDFLAGVDPSYDLDGTTVSPNGSWAGALAEDGEIANVDFGYSGTGSIGGTVWFDQNRDGVVDPTEARLDAIDVTVTWLGPDDVLGSGDDVQYSATSSVTGTYLVGSLPPGEFEVEIDTSTLPIGYVNVSDPGAENDNLSQLTLAGGAADLGHDFGYAGTDLIGDLVWLDQDGDGTQNGTEPGLGGIILELTHFGVDGVAGGGDDSTFTTTTGAAGNYEFTGLPPGVFEVEVTGGVPASATNSYDPDTVGAGDARSILTLVAGTADLDQDFGFSATSVLGDRVWWDLNSDGVQDLGEPGLNGIDVTATYLGPDTTLGTIDDQVFVTTTNSDGDYLFTGVSDGEYLIAVSGGVPTGFSITYDEDSGTTSPDETIDLTLTTAHLTADFGYSGAGSVGDAIWFDADLDGTLGVDEFGLADVDVDLTWFGADGLSGGGDDIVLTTTSAADGTYAFTGLPAGFFAVDVIGPTLAPGLIPTFDADSGTSSPDGSTSVVLAIGEAVSDRDFGYAGTGSVGDAVWFDHDGDGSIGADEVGLANVDIDIVWDSPSGPQSFATTTDALGNYIVANLPPGDFTISVDTSTLPGGVVATHDADAGFDAMSATTLADGQDDLVHDFGFRGSATIGDTIWLDLDGDGSQGPSEPGVAGQPLVLTWQSPSGPVIFTTDTDASGNYLFTSLADGAYTVTVLNGIVDLANNTGDPGADADSTNDLVITGGTSDLDQDFGYQGLNSVGDLVWIDDDRNGSFDSNEQGIASASLEVQWYGVDGVLGGGDDVTLPRETTDAAGGYNFTGLPDGGYTITVVDGLPAGVDTPSHDADSGTANPDATSEVLDLGVGSTIADANNDQDFGFTGNGTIGETIWLNLNGDAIQDSNEPGVADVQVTLTWAGFDATFGTADDIVYPSQTTDEFGTYSFEYLPPGLHQVSYDDDLPAGIEPQVDPDGGDLTTASVTLGPNETSTTQNFGVAGNATLTGSVFLDSDGDGVQDPDEEPIPGVMVTVRWEGPAGPVDFTLETDVDGMWELANMPPGEYIVLLGLATVPPELVPTIPIITELTVEPATVVVANNGLVAGASIGDLVWHDDDRSGAVTTGEIGVESVRVNLSNSDGDVVRSTESALDGEYLFEGLTPGDYTVQVDESSFPANMEIVSSPEDEDDDDTMTTVALEPAMNFETADFGLDDPESDTAPALAFTGRSVGDMLLLAGVLLWLGMMLIEGTRPRRKPVVVHLKISSDGRTVVT